MAKLIDEFRRGWQGISQPSLLFSIGFAVLCLALATLGRWGLAQIRPDVFFTPYFPAVFIATVFGGFRIGIADGARRRRARRRRQFRRHRGGFRRELALLVIFWAVCGVAIWGVEHYRSIAAHEQEVLKTPDRGRANTAS